MKQGKRGYFILINIDAAKTANLKQIISIDNCFWFIM